MDRQADLEHLALDHALQVHVHDGVARRMHLHVAHDRRLRLRIHLQADDGGVELLVVDQRQQLLVIEHEIRRLTLAAVENGGDLTGTTQAAARTLALIVTRVRADLKCATHVTELLILIDDISRHTATSAPAPQKPSGQTG